MEATGINGNTIRLDEIYMATEKIRRMVTDGFTLGAHCVTHIRFDQLSEEALRDEILDSCRFVQEMTGEEQVPLALPFDTKGVDRDFLRRLRKDNPLFGRAYARAKVKALIRKFGG
jgi:peptidoglycan/xylan/chitin deacetylase (PgdA/CDA1 family)